MQYSQNSMPYLTSLKVKPYTKHAKDYVKIEQFGWLQIYSLKLSAAAAK